MFEKFRMRWFALKNSKSISEDIVYNSRFVKERMEKSDEVKTE